MFKLLIYFLCFRSSQRSRREANVGATVQQNEATVQPNSSTNQQNSSTNQQNRSTNQQNATVRNLLIDASDGPPSDFASVMNLFQVKVDFFVVNV